ncbi:MAG: hypothetical protein PWP06_1220 [Candidatus Marinimicrobia bacterium]|jgi:hypothetical protein|nr:hypothetical protein [Candidatus Neomarinimicrobiota bacterium]
MRLNSVKGTGLSTISVILLACSFIFFACAPEEDSLIIGIVGDQFGAYDTEKALDIMEKGVAMLENYQPQILLHVGDMVESVRDVDSYEDYKALFNRAAGIMEKTGLPWLVALGDHDVVPPGYQPLSKDRSRENWFLSLSQETSLPIDSLPYYSYTLNGYHFISLYSMENLHTDPRWGSIFLNQITDKQLAWLKKDLETHSSAKAIMVLVHHPQWYVWSNWSRVHNVLKEYNVKAVLAGHYHYDQDDGEIDGIRYLVMGATGGAVKTSDAHSGGTHMVGLMKLTPRGLEDIRLVDVPGDTLLELTPRRSMDRIQALSCMLDNLYQDAQFIHTPTEIPEKVIIRLASLANPIDVPIQLSIDTQPRDFEEIRWLNHPDTTPPITLNPGERIGWANYSSTGQWFTPPPLWEGTTSRKFFEKKGSIPVTIKVSFSDTRTRSIQKTIDFTFD